MTTFTTHPRANQSVAQQIWAEVKALAAQYNIAVPATVINSHLKAANGRICYRFTRPGRTINRDPSTMRIEMSLDFLLHFPWERIKETVRHEFAHYLCLVRHGESGHSYQFKLYCEELGGRMNERLAAGGFEHLAATSDEFVTAHTRKHQYTCKCGNTVKRYRPYSQRDLNGRHCTSCHTFIKDWSYTRLN